MNVDLLKTLIDDHLGGAVAAIKLAKEWQEHHAGSDVAATFATVIPQIEEDKALLEKMLGAIGAKPSTTKQVMGWFGEQFIDARLKAVDARDSAAGLVFMLETLLMGIHGKRLLWEALQAIQPDVPALAGYDFAHLIQRADQQHASLDAHHAAASRRAFVA